MDRTGQILLGKYELTRMLGKGGMGEVWEGEHQLTGRRVAVKVLSDNYLSNRKVVARFGREARAASAVQHEGIVEILDQDKTDDGVPFLVMEFLEGESVGERLRKRGKLPQEDAFGIMLPLLDALDAAHQAGVIHRDLKPDNVFILPGGRGEERIKILDFGISRKADEIEHHLTQEGSVLGTPHYMSPEQARGETGIDARADLYAAAVLFYECVVGDVPFDAGNYNALLQIILGTPPAPPRGRGADIAPAVEQVILAALEKEKARRPPTARAFHRLLSEAASQPEGVRLDSATWTFTPAARPTIDTKPEVPELVPVAALVPTGSAPASGVRRAPGTKGQDSGEFAFIGSLPVSAPAGGVRPSAAVPPPPAPAAPLAAAPAPWTSAAPPWAPAPAARPAPREVGLAHRPEPRAEPRPPRGERPPLGAEREGGRGRSIARAVANWLAVVAAVAVLVYLANLVFSRPDPRKSRRIGPNPDPVHARE